MKTNKSNAAHKVWAVVTANPDSQEPGYLAYVSIFASRAAALKCMRNTAEEDAECYQGRIVWLDEDTDEPWCQIIVNDNVVRITHMLEQHTIQ